MSREKSIIPVFNTDDELKKHNTIIGGMYKLTVFENKVFDIALSRIKYDEDTGTLYSQIKASEIKKILNNKNGSFYATLDTAARHFTGKPIGISNPDTQEFDYIAVIIRATYKDAELYVKWNEDLKEYLYNLRDRHFATFRISYKMAIKNLYAYRLYEILKSKAYHPKRAMHNNENAFLITISLPELKFKLGVANIENETVQKYLKKNKNPDYQQALELDPDRMYDEWCDFEYYVLKKAIKEINDKTDISVTYNSLGYGLGGKIHSVAFTVNLTTNKQIVEAKTLSQEEKNAIIEDIMYEKVSERIRIKEAEAIAEAANWDIEKISKAFNAYRNAKEVENMVGYLITAIKENYEPSSYYEDKSPKQATKRNSWHNKDLDTAYDQMDFVDFEQQILSN